MSNGDDEPEDAPEEAESAEGAADTGDAGEDTEEETQTDPAELATEFEERLDDAAASLEEAETETARDEVEATLDEIETDLAATEFPEPEEGEEGEPAPDYRADLEARLAELREALAAARPPEVVVEFRRRFETVEDELEAAESQADFDDAEATLDAIESDLAEATFPEPTEPEEGEGEAAEEAEGEEAEAEAVEPVPDYRADLEARLATDRAEVAIGRYRIRIESVEADLEEAETEADLDVLDERLDEVESDLEAADLPEPEAEDAPQPREEVESLLSDARAAVEEERGPYAEDVVADIEAAKGTIEDSEWTEQEGVGEVADAVESFLESFDEVLDTSITAASRDHEDLLAALDEAIAAVEDASLDPDEDAETIADLLEATDGLQTGLEESTTWSDLEVRVQLQRQGFYDRLTSENRKDFPPELGVVRIAEQENDPERILMALGYLESNFMEDNVLDALRRLAPEEAIDPMLQRAQKRDQPAIEVLGKIGADEAVDTLLDFIEGEGNPPLQKTTLRALGEIGSEEATEAVAQRLVADDPEVRSHAARALGRIGDTRAVDPLADTLADDDVDAVRGAAAWALNQISTESALEAVAEYQADRAYVVQAEAEKAADALPTTDPESGDDDDGGEEQPAEAEEPDTESEADADSEDTEEGGSDEAAA